MNVPHFADVCIVCLRAPPFECNGGFSREHVIPDALGGRLTCDFLCKPCNDSFGRSFEARAKTDPAIRLAIRQLRATLPKLYESIEEGQKHFIETPIGSMEGRFRGGSIVGKTRQLDDRSMMVPENQTEDHLRRTLTHDGLSIEEIEAALICWRDGPWDTRFEISPGIEIIKHHSTGSRLDFSNAQSLDELVCLKIAYEFCAMFMGTEMLRDAPPLNDIRAALLNRNFERAKARVEPLIAKTYEPFHGILFEGNKPDANVQIRLFGKLAYRVHLGSVALDRESFGYTLRLDTNTEDVNEPKQA